MEQDIFLRSTSAIDSEHPVVQAYVKPLIADCKTNKEKVVSIYYAVRDGWYYTATRISFREEDMRASALIRSKAGHCIEKSVLMIAFCRAAGVPARLCLSKVKNHIAAEHVEQLFGTDVLVPHGYVEVWIDDRWVKATPAFNKELCEKLGVAPLEFNGEQDSLFQSFSADGTVFMEYLEDYGYFEDLPLDFIIRTMREHYPVLLQKGYALEPGSVLDIKKDEYQKK